MQVLCKSSHSQADIRCPVCHQSFVLYFERNCPAERAETRLHLLDALAAQHAATPEPHAHPRIGFNFHDSSTLAFA